MRSDGSSSEGLRQLRRKVGDGRHERINCCVATPSSLTRTPKPASTAPPAWHSQSKQQKRTTHPLIVPKLKEKGVRVRSAEFFGVGLKGGREKEELFCQVDAVAVLQGLFSPQAPCRKRPRRRAAHQEARATASRYCDDNIHICFPSNTLEARTNSLAQGSTVSADEQAQDQDELTDSDNLMLLDDTKHTSYIYDIERELASIEAEEKRISFLPDIEKVLNAIPNSILSEPKPEQNELVLYRVPRSLTVTEDQDNVRKAIIESRARARARQAESSAYSPSVVPQSDDKDNSVFTFEADDVMDVDSLQQ